MKPNSLYQVIAKRQAEKGQHAFSSGVEWMWNTHFGSTALVDEIDEICRAHSEAWEAANVIIEKYMRGNSTAARSARPQWVKRCGVIGSFLQNRGPDGWVIATRGTH
jgi:hypothetical protein